MRHTVNPYATWPLQVHPKIHAKPAARRRVLNIGSPGAHKLHLEAWNERPAETRSLEMAGTMLLLARSPAFLGRGTIDDSLGSSVKNQVGKCISSPTDYLTLSSTRAKRVSRAV